MNLCIRCKTTLRDDTYNETCEACIQYIIMWSSIESLKLICQNAIRSVAVLNPWSTSMHQVSDNAAEL